MRSIYKMMMLGGILLTVFAAAAFGQEPTAPPPVQPAPPVPVPATPEPPAEPAPPVPSAPSAEQAAAAVDAELPAADPAPSAARNESPAAESAARPDADDAAEPSEEQTAAKEGAAGEGEGAAEQPAAEQAGAEPDSAEASGGEELAEGSEDAEVADDADDADGSDPEQLAAGEEVGGRSRMKIGVMRLETLTGQDKLAAEMTEALVARLDTLGLYEIYLPDDIDRALASAKIRKPSNCRDPLCVIGIAKALGLRRMIIGTVDMNGSRCGVRLELLDVALNRPVETVSIEGAAGVPAKHVLQSAIDRIHGYSSEADVSAYYGPSLRNTKELLWSTVAVQGAGMFYSVINYGLGRMGSLPPEALVAGAYGDNDDLSGIPASANHIPMFARPAALANAYTAVSDDAYGVLYNPAGMPWVAGREAALGYQSRFGLDLLALSYVNKATRDIGFGQALLLSTDRDNAMTELYFVTAAGYKVNHVPFMGPMSFGASIKMMGNTVNSLSPDSPEGQSFGGGLDLGLMWELSSNIRYGVHLKDALSLNRWKNRTTGHTYSEWMPPTLHMGGSYRAGYNAFFVADGEIPLYEDQPWVMAGGIEYEFFRIFALRVGLQREIMDEESDWWKITGGGGIKFDIEPLWGKYLYLDFGYEYNTLELFSVVNVSVRVGF